DRNVTGVQTCALPICGGFGGMHGGGEPGITRVNVSPRMRLADVIKRIEAIPMGGTDCALPMLWAARNKLNVSAFVTYTDSETWEIGRASCRERWDVPV